MEFRIESYEEITSTNDRVKQAIDADEPEGLAVRALVQTAGYGRQGRAWQSPLGGMYQSFLLRPQVPPAQLPTLSLLVGLAVRRAVVGLVPQLSSRAQVKWPNDLVVAPLASGATGEAASAASAAFSSAAPSSSAAPLSAAAQSSPEAGSSAAAPSSSAAGSSASSRSPQPPQPFLKLGGISLEAHRGAVCVGVGVNVSRSVDEAQGGGKNIPVFLDELGLSGDRVEERIARVADAVCDQIAALYPEWCRVGFAPFAEELNACSALTGRVVRMEDIEGNLLASGTVRSICPDGRLVLGTPEGEEILVGSGEAHIRA